MRRILFDILEINIAVSIVILILCLFESKLRKCYGAGWLKVVWILLAVRLVVPYNFSLPTTEIRLFNVPGFEQEESISQAIGTTEASIIENTSSANAEDNGDTLESLEQEFPIVKKAGSQLQSEDVIGSVLLSLSYSKILAIIWILGMGATFWYYGISYTNFFGKCRKTLQPVEDEMLLRQIHTLQEQYIGKVKLQVYESAVITGPMLIGIMQPKLVLPVSKQNWQAEELSMVVAHELCHYKNKDLWLKLVMLVAWCVNWFNPLVFYMKKQFFYNMELACDEAVLAEREEEERYSYARIMLSFADKGKDTSAFSTGFGSSKKRMKKRIDYMLDKGAKKKGVFSMVLLGAMMLTICLFVSCGYKPEELEGNDTGSSQVSTEQQDIESVEETEAHPEAEKQQDFENQQELGEQYDSEEDIPEKDDFISTEQNNISETTPSKVEVFAMRTKVLEGMSEEEITRLKENIKVANMAMERAYFYEDLFGKLSDPEHLYWNYIDQKGDIQIGWESDGSPLIEYNRFDADNFIALMEEMRDSLKNDLLEKDFNNLIDNMTLAKETHEVEYVEQIYRILHDMDYFLLRYGIEDVGKYLEDLSTVEKYYGVLECYDLDAN